MKLVLDTHFVLWIVTDAARLDTFPWLERYAPWGVSPISFLEVQFLGEVGRLQVDSAAFTEAVGRDPRFRIDEVPLVALIRQTLPLDWTRDPFDRLLCAHSSARRAPLCSVDRDIRQHHPLLPEPLRNRE